MIDWLIEWLTVWLIDWLIDWLSEWVIDWKIHCSNKIISPSHQLAQKIANTGTPQLTDCLQIKGIALQQQITLYIIQWISLFFADFAKFHK